MRLAQRLVLNTVVVAVVLLTIVLFLVERRVTERVRDDASPAVAAQADVFLRSMRRDILVAGSVVLVLGIAFARTLARPIAGPIEELSEVARALAAGDLSRRPLLSGPGEVGELDDALRRLAAQLDARHRALHAEDSLLVALTESLNEGVIAVDRHRRVVRINGTARTLLRLDEPTPFSTHFLPMERGLQQALDAVLSGAEADPDRSEVRLFDRTLALTARPLPAGGAVLALFDLTPFRTLEAVRRDFVANVSHELRTPLTVISGFVDTLQDDELSPELRQQFLGMAGANVRRMQRIIDDLLDLSRIESGGWLPNPSDLDFAAVASEIVTPLEGAAAARGVVLRVEVGPGAASLYADTTAARQILSNLAENALRHTVSGEVVVFSAAERGGVHIGVRDTGTGIAAEHLPRIFERFYRPDPGRARDVGGTGLGLSIVRHLAESHGGRVYVDSEPGVGTTISTWFPGDPG